MNKNNNEKIVTEDVNSVSKRLLLNYGLSIILGRAIPDVRDGMKPVNRRIIWSMFINGMLPTSPFQKSARIVGNTMGAYHPHGDSSIYDALVRMSQLFKNQIPLIDGHGNFGSVDGDSPAAMRYTEARLSNLGLALVKGISPKIVPFVDNFDSTLKEPEVLPAEIPALLINGTSGVAYAYKTDIPQHNPEEVLKAFIAYTKNRKISLDELMKILPAPDFSTGGEIINKKGLKEFYNTGVGRIVMQSTYTIDEKKHQVHLTSFPYKFAGNLLKLKDNIVSKVSDRTLPEITDLEDNSDNIHTDIVLSLKKNVNIKKFMEKLFHYTDARTSTKIEFYATKGKNLHQYSLKEYFSEYLSFEMNIIKNKKNEEKNDLEHKLEINIGTLEAIKYINPIIDLIKHSKSVKQMTKVLTTGDTSDVVFELKQNEKLAKKFQFTDAQAEYILQLPLRRLSSLNKDALLSERKHLNARLKEVNQVLSSNVTILHEVQKRHIEKLKQYKTPRKTKVSQLEIKPFVEEKEINKVRVLVDKYFYVKMTNDFKSKADSTVIKEFELNSDQKISFVTNEGHIYDLQLSKLKLEKMKDKGTSVNSLLGFNSSEFVINVFNTQDFKDKKIVIFTKHGLGKILDGNEFAERKRTKTYFLKLKDNDEIIKSMVIKENESVTLASYLGYVKKINLLDISEQGKLGSGINVFKFKEDEDSLTSVFSEKSGIINGKEVDFTDIPVKKTTQVPVKLD